MTGALHNAHHIVKWHSVGTIGVERVDLGIDCTGGSHSVALDAGNLYKTTHWVASHTKVVFESHLGCILNLRRRTTHQLACGSGSHCTRHTNLALATNLCARHRSIGFYNSTHQTCRGKRPDDLTIGEVVLFLQVVEHCGYNTTRTTPEAFSSLTASA